MNELAMVCHTRGIDVAELLDAAATKPFGFLAHRPGPGAGGDCIPVAARFLATTARRWGLAASVVEAAVAVNDRMPDHVVEQVERLLVGQGLAPLPGAKVLVVGVTYKPNVPNVRGSAAVRIIERLHAWASVSYCDPYVPEIRLSNGRVLRAVWPEPDTVDLVLIVTRHDVVDHAVLVHGLTPVIDCSSGQPRLLTTNHRDPNPAVPDGDPA